MVFVMSCLYNAVSLTLVREQSFIRIIIIIVVVILILIIIIEARVKVNSRAPVTPDEGRPLAEDVGVEPDDTAEGGTHAATLLLHGQVGADRGRRQLHVIAHPVHQMHDP